MNLFYVDTTTDGSTIVLAPGGLLSSDVQLTPGVYRTIGQSIFHANNTVTLPSPNVFNASEYLVTRFTTAGGSSTFASEHISVGIEGLSDLSCRISMTRVNDE